ncbi:MAG: hypothetical protein WB799_19690 [Candidatus Sulfotelmatobacter sp.]
MKFCKVSLCLALFAGLCLPAVAQAGMGVNIPFDFVASGKSLPAGHYTVARAFSSNSAILWHIYNDHNSANVITQSVESVQKVHRPSLIFFQANGTYSLVEFWTSKHSGRALPKSNTNLPVVAEGGKYVEVSSE